MSKENVMIHPAKSVTEQDLQPFSIHVSQEVISPFTNSKLLFGITTDNEKVVAKITTSPDGNLREWEGLQKVSIIGTQVQEGIVAGQLDDGSPVLVTREIEGKSLVNVPGEIHRRNLGHLLKKIHAKTKIDGIEWEKSGKKDFRYYDWHLSYWHKKAEEISPVCRRAVSIIDTLVETASSYFQSSEPVFTHQDLHDEQVLINTNNLEVVIDFENWKEADYLDDLAMYLFHSIREESPITFYHELLNGYLNEGKTTDQENSIIAFDTLFFALRAVGYFHKFNLPYLDTALSNLVLVTKFIDQETPWK